MTYIVIALIVVAIIIFYPYVTGGGAKGLVKLMFIEFVKFNKMISPTSDNRFKLGNNIFNTKNDVKTFILNLIFEKRISPSERQSDRFDDVFEKNGKVETIEFEYNGIKQSAEFYRIINLGDLICKIWFIESGLLASYFYATNTGFDFMYDESSSKVITKEYQKQLKINPEVNE